MGVSPCCICESTEKMTFHFLLQRVGIPFLSSALESKISPDVFASLPKKWRFIFCSRGLESLFVETKKTTRLDGFSPRMGKAVICVCAGNSLDHLPDLSNTISVVMMKLSLYKESVRCVLQKIQIPERRFFMYVNLDLFHIHSGKEMKLQLPTHHLESCVKGYCSVEELHKQVLSLEMESDFEFTDTEFVNIPLLNKTLLKIKDLSSRDFSRFFRIWKVQDEKDLFTLINTLNYFDNYEIIDKTKTDKKTIANLVSYALFGCDLAWELESQLTPNNVNALIHAGLKSGILKETDTDFYVYDNYVLEQNVIQSAETLEKLPLDRKAG